jgi:transposase
MPKQQRTSAKLDTLRRQGTCNPHPETVTHSLFQGKDSDFFDARDLLQVKYEMLRSVEVEKDSVTQAAAAFGFSRPSFYQAQAALQRAGLVGLIPQKRGPRTAHKLSTKIMEFVHQSRATQPMLRLPELARLIQERFGVQVHPRSIERRLLRQKKRH